MIAPRVSWQQCPGFAIPPFLQEHTAAFTSPLPAAEGSRNVATAAGDFSPHAHSATTINKEPLTTFGTEIILQ